MDQPVVVLGLDHRQRGPSRSLGFLEVVKGIVGWVGWPTGKMQATGPGMDVEPDRLRGRRDQGPVGS
jgi:hypothetical protein